MYMLYKNKYIYNLQGGSGGVAPKKQKKFKNKSNKMEAFPLFFFAFWQGSLDPQNNELAPQIP